MRTLLIAVVLLVQGTTGVAQNYIPLFSGSSRAWKTEFSGTIDAQCMDHWTTSYWLAGDTTIDGLTYTRVRSSIVYWESTIVAMDCNAWDEYDGETHFVREVDRMVFMRIPGEDDRMIYDFAADVGDTIPYPSNFPTNTNWESDDLWATVVAIDSVIVDSTYRERLVIDTSASPDMSWGRPYVIEGIGGGQGPFQPLCGQIGLSHGTSLICVSEYNEWIFGDTLCYIYTAAQDDPVRMVPTVYPNPTTGIIYLDELMEYTVTDLTGMPVQRGRGRTFDLSSHGAGIYMLRLQPSAGTVLGIVRIVLLGK